MVSYCCKTRSYRINTCQEISVQPLVYQAKYILNGAIDPEMMGHSMWPKFSAAFRSLSYSDCDGGFTSWNRRSTVHCCGSTNNALPGGHVNNLTPFIVPSSTDCVGSSSSSSTPTMRIFVHGKWPIHLMTP